MDFGKMGLVLSLYESDITMENPDLSLMEHKLLVRRNYSGCISMALEPIAENILDELMTQLGELEILDHLLSRQI